MNKIYTNKIFPIFIPQQGCQFKCIYCNQFTITKSIEIIWSKVLDDVEAFLTKHKEKNKEIAFFGGTFTSLPMITMNEYFNRILALIKDNNTYFRISTRPDVINDKILQFLREKRVNTIELGIQSFSNLELDATKRGYTSQTAVDSCKLIQKFGFNLCTQLMIGLPSSNEDTINETINILQDIKPDYARIYPLVVLKNTELECIYQKGEYEPLSIGDAIKITKNIKNACDTIGIKIIKIGLHADIEKEQIIAGPFHERFAELLYE